MDPSGTYLEVLMFTVKGGVVKTIPEQIDEIERVLHYWTEGPGKDTPEAPGRIAKLKQDRTRLEDKKAVFDAQKREAERHARENRKRPTKMIKYKINPRTNTARRVDA